MAEAAQHSGDRATKANALEYVLAGKDNTNLPDGLFDFNADSLWNSYIDYATGLGNRQQFLIGQDKQWFKAAEKAEKKQPVRARSFYALLMLQGQDTQFRTAATERFVSLLKKRDKGNEILKQLFMQSKQAICQAGNYARGNSTCAGGCGTGTIRYTTGFKTNGWYQGTACR